MNEYTPEELQKKLYTIQSKLQSMCQQLPPSYQTRISVELLSSLAQCLLNDTAFSIVKSLMDIQHETEKQLFHKRARLKYQLECELSELLDASDLNESEKNVVIAQKKIEHQEQVRNFNRYIIHELDKKVLEQQTILEEAGVPGFHRTDNFKEIRVQMYLLEFILRLSKFKTS